MSGTAGLKLSEFESSPAVDMGCMSRFPKCGICHPNPMPCTEYMGDEDEYPHWCPVCGWAPWAHSDIALEHHREWKAKTHEASS